MMLLQRMHRTTTILASIAFIVATGGCADTRGPELVLNSHLDYNRAVSQVLKEELLLNVVRRRYMEAPQFLNISSVNSNFSTTTEVGAAVSVADLGSANVWGGSVDGSARFSDNPTITITPRQGEDMANQLHQPLSVGRVADLVSAGYGVEGIFDALVESANGLAGPDLRYDRFVPASSEWNESMTLLSRLYDEGLLVLDRFRWNDPYNSHPFPAESITPEMWITTLSTGARRWRSWDGGKSF